MRFWVAWRFLTILPAPRRGRSVAEGLGKSLGFFPVVGLILGLALFGLDRLMGLFLPPLLVNALLVSALVVFTGALHIDGFIDTCDGLAVASSTRDKLKAMGDSRVGGFGVVGGCCLIVCKFAALAALPGALRGAALILMPVLGRWGMVGAVSFFGSAKSHGMGSLAKREASWKDAAMASVFSVAVAMALLGWWGAAVLGMLCLVLLGASKWLCHVFGGLTGDTYGAIGELAELAVLILIILVGGLGGYGWLGALL